MVVLWNRLWLRAYELTLNYRIILRSVLRRVALVKPKISAHDGHAGGGKPNSRDSTTDSNGLAYDRADPVD